MVATRAVMRGAQAAGLSFMQFVRRGLDPTSIAVMLEDGAAVTGLVIAGNPPPLRMSHLHRVHGFFRSGVVAVCMDSGAGMFPGRQESGGSALQKAGSHAICAESEMMKGSHEHIDMKPVPVYSVLALACRHQAGYLKCQAAIRVGASRSLERVW